MSCGTISRFQLVVTRVGNRDVLTLKVELKDKTADQQKLIIDMNDVSRVIVG